MLCHHFPMPYGFTYEKAFWHSPSLSSGVLANFPSSVSPCFALVFRFCGAKVVKGAADKIPPCYFACLLPADFPFSLMLGQSGYSERTHEIIWSFAPGLSLFSAPKKSKTPTAMLQPMKEIKKSLHSRRRRKGKNLIPLGTQA